jgi:hypothetical protein
MLLPPLSVPCGRSGAGAGDAGNRAIQTAPLLLALSLLLLFLFEQRRDGQVARVARVARRFAIAAGQMPSATHINEVPVARLGGQSGSRRGRCPPGYSSLTVFGPTGGVSR